MRGVRASGLPSFAAAAALVVAVACVYAATARGFFYADDFGNLGLARDLPFDGHFLTLRYFGHLAPGHRVVDWLVVSLGAHYRVSVLLLLAIVLAGAAATYDLTKRLSGRPWLAAALATGFAASPVWVRVVEWLASAGHIVPSVAASLLCMAAAVRWFGSGHRRWLVAALVAFAVALAFYEKPLLVPLYLVFLRYGSGLAIAAPLRSLRRDLPLWLGMVAIGVLYLLAISSGDGVAPSAATASAHSWAEYARIVWLRGSTPLLIGTWPSRALDGTAHLYVWAAQVAFFTLVVASLVRSPRAWRAWAFYVVALALNAGLIASGRLADFGSGIAFDLRYNAETVILLPVAIAAAWGTSLPSRRSVALPRAAAIALGALGTAAFCVATVHGYRLLRKDWPAYGTTRPYVERLRADARRLGAIDGSQRAAVLDGNADFAFGPILQPPYQTLSQVLSFVAPEVNVGGDAERLLRVGPDGHLSVQPERQLARRTVAGACRPDRTVVFRVPAAAEQVLRFRLSADSAAGNIDVFLARDGADFGYVPDFSATVEPGQLAFRSLGAAGVTRVLLRPTAGTSVCVGSATVTTLDSP